MLVAPVAGGSLVKASGSILLSTAIPPKHGLYRLDIESGKLTRLTTGSHDWNGSWSRDGKQIAFDRGHVSAAQKPESSLMIVGSDGKELHSVGDVQAYGVSWGPGDKELAIVDSKGGISIVSLSGTVLKKLAPSGSDPSWSPDGRTILYVDVGTIYLVNADGTDIRSIVKHPADTSKHVYRFDQPAWAPNGASISFVESDLFNANKGTLETARPDGSDRHTVAQLPDWEDFSVIPPFWSPDSRSIAFFELHRDQPWLVTVPSTGGKATPLFKGIGLSGLAPTSPTSWTAAG